MICRRWPPRGTRENRRGEPESRIIDEESHRINEETQREPPMNLRHRPKAPMNLHVTLIFPFFSDSNRKEKKKGKQFDFSFLSKQPSYPLSPRVPQASVLPTKLFITLRSVVKSQQCTCSKTLQGVVFFF